MKVLIVAKTRLGSGVCIGAITEEGESVRLIPFNEDSHDRANREYEIGDVWEIASRPETSLIPPHNEDIRVREKRYLYLASASELEGAIERFMPPKIGGANRAL